MLAALAAAAALAAPAPAAQAQTAGSAEPGAGRTLTVAPPSGTAPPGRRRTASDITRRALRHPRMVRLRARHPEATTRSFLLPENRWQVSVYDRGGGRRREVGQVILDDRTGRVLEAWTGVQVQWPMARGYAGAFGRRASAVYVWLPLLVLFLLPFLRPPYRLVHLDLAAVALLSVSYAFFNAAEIGASVPLAYPPLIYLLIRMLLLARSRGRGAGGEPPPLRTLVGPDFLGLAIVFLLGFRLGLNITSSNVIDVGYASVIGADLLAHGEPVYGNFPPSNAHGDTYGPANYLAYVPFELIAPWSGAWDDLPAAHAAAFTFDLACLGGLWLAGRRLRGPRLGLLLAYLWLACPFTLLAVNSGSNDALVGALVLGAFLLARRPLARGALIGVAGLTKFAPLALAPLFAAHGGGGRAVARTLAGTGAATALLLAVVIATDGGLGGLWERAIGYQAGRDSPFSVWGWYGLPGPQLAVQVAAVALALAVAFVPRRRDDVSLAALAAAVLLALQLGVSHWFYLYVVWFLPLVLIAGLAAHGEPVTGRAAGRARSTPPAAAPGRSG